MKISSTVLKTSRRGDRPAEFIKLHKTKRRITFTDKKGIGELKLLGKWDIQFYNLKDIKRVRLIRRADGYYAQFCVGIDVVDIQPKTGKEIGLDVGIESFYTDSNGHHEPNPNIPVNGLFPLVNGFFMKRC